MSKCYVKAYYDWIEQTAALSDAERGRLFIAILEYARSGLDPKLDGREGILFPAFRTMLDRDAEVSAKRSESGSRGGRASKANESKVKQNEANESKIANKDIRHKTKTEDYPPLNPPQGNLFDVFWTVYPRKVGRGAAEKAFERINPDKQTLDRMIQAIDQQRCSAQWQRDGGQYIPNPATWLSQRRWEDDLTTVQAQPNAGYSFDIAAAERKMEANARGDELWTEPEIT